MFRVRNNMNLWLVLLVSSQLLIGEIWGNVIVVNLEPNEEDVLPFNVPKKQADVIKSILQMYRNSLIVFPEFDLSKWGIATDGRDHVHNYVTPIPKEELCNNAQDFMRDIFCAPNNNAILLHIIEESGDKYYSSMVYVANSTLKQIIRKKENYHNSILDPYTEAQNNIIQYNDMNITVIMGFDILDMKKPTDDVIYINNIFKPILPFFLDVSLMSGLSKVYNVDVQAPNYDYSGSHRQSVVHINAKTGLQENEYKVKKEMNYYDIDKNNFTLQKITENSAKIESCEVNIENGDTTNYRLVWFRGEYEINLKLRNLTVCALVKTTSDNGSLTIKLDEPKPSSFGKITLILKTSKEEYPLPTTLTANMMPVKNYEFKSTDTGFELSADDAESLISFGFILGNVNHSSYLDGRLGAIYWIVLIFVRLLI
ncbi:uncharacterized protein LOC109595151 [Aethina tumida]|uniref:uncharacterized protein LOC109595151 n=1 Tax=Aethina tumida TaxID=116153 RepID=UPI00096B0CD0|nr:uncharacterized protein LOC109595151 [Aethina tumida]